MRIIICLLFFSGMKRMKACVDWLLKQLVLFSIHKLVISAVAVRLLAYEINGEVEHECL